MISDRAYCRTPALGYCTVRQGHLRHYRRGQSLQKCPKVYRRPVSNPHGVGDTMRVRSPSCSNGFAQRCPNKILARIGPNGDKLAKAMKSFDPDDSWTEVPGAKQAP